MEPIKLDLNDTIFLNVGVCTACQGKGKIWGMLEETICPECTGAGRIQREVTLSKLFEAFRQMLRYEGI